MSTTPIPRLPQLQGWQNITSWADAVLATLKSHNLDDFVRYDAAVDYYPVKDEDQAECNSAYVYNLLRGSLALNIPAYLAVTGVWNFARRDNPAELFDTLKAVFGYGIEWQKMKPEMRPGPTQNAGGHAHAHGRGQIQKEQAGGGKKKDMREILARFALENARKRRC